MSDDTPDPRAGSTGLAERTLDEVLPEELDWRHLMSDYPWPCLLVAAGGGFVLGRSRGPLILSALVSFAGRQAAGAVGSLLDDEEAEP